MAHHDAERHCSIKAALARPQLAPARCCAVATAGGRHTKAVRWLTLFIGLIEYDGAELDLPSVVCCCVAAGNVTELTEQLSSLEASSNELSSKLQDLQQEHSQVGQLLVM